MRKFERRPMSKDEKKSQNGGNVSFVPSLAFLLISLLLVVQLTAEKDNMISGLPDLHHMDGLRNALDSGETQLHLNL